MLGHFGLSDAFVSIYGSELSGENADKADLIRHVLSAERFEEPPQMVGDQRHDIEAAHANGLPGVGVLWGYGSRRSWRRPAQTSSWSPWGSCASGRGAPRGDEVMAGREPG